MARLAGGMIVADGQAAWAPGADGLPVRQGRNAGAPPGRPVAVGPADASAIAVKAALDGLERLVAAGGAAAAGAGVDLGGGFRSARLAGAPEERRDCVLAAGKALWPDGVDRLGERAAVVVALFGPRATKRLGAALNRAAGDGRWPAIHFAVAASDLLGPERLERLLVLDGPEGTDPIPGGEPSVLSGFLLETLGPFPETRRLALLQSLWERVAATQAATADARRQRERLLATQDGDDALEPARARRWKVDDDWILGFVENACGHPPTVAEAARWIPSPTIISDTLQRILADAFAATALARLAVAAADGPLEAALAEHLDVLIQGACPGIKGGARSQLRRLRGPHPEAGRPGQVAAEIAAAAILATQPGVTRPVQIRGAILNPGRLDDFVRPRLATARTHGIVTLERVRLHLADEGPSGGPRWDALTARLHPWRKAAGFGPARPPQDWQHPPYLTADPSLAERLAAHPSLPAFAVETAQDLLWFADLGDAVAALHGHAGAAVAVQWGRLTVDVDPAPPEPEPLRAPTDSIPAAAAGAAQLVRLGAEIPARPASWDALTDALLASAGIAELLVSDFLVPPAILERDGGPLPGTDLIVEVARTARQLADWALVMANCIASYADEGRAGTSVLLALRPPTGPVRFNAELCRARGGWRIAELLGRFNTDPPAEMTAALRAWAADLPAPPPVRPPAPRRRAGRGRRGPARRARPTPAVLAARAALADACAARVDPALAEAIAPLGARLGWQPDGDAFGAVTALRRTPLHRLAETVADALAGGWPPGDLWAATAGRPLAAGLADVDEATRRLLRDVETLLGDGPLPAGARPLVRLVPVARARGVEVGLRRVRGALGLLLRQADQRLDAALAAHPALDPLCAAVLALTAWDGTGEAVERPLASVALSDIDVAGVSSSSLLDEQGPWAAAWVGARDIGAPVEDLRSRAEAADVAALVVPAAWLGRRGWPALWARAHRGSRPRR